MNEENLRKKLEIDIKLELMKEHKCCAESILCIETYMYRLEQENEQLKSQLQKISVNFLKYDWKNSNPSQLKNQIKSLYYSIYSKGEINKWD